MSENIKAGSAAPDDAGSAADQEIETQDAADTSGGSDTVKYETYLKKKRTAENLAIAKRELEDKVASLEQRQLESEGKKDEVIEHLKKQVAQLAGEKNKIVGNFAYNSLNSQISAEAAKLGCVDTDALVQLMDVKSFMNSIDTETFKANAEEIRAAIEDQKKRRAYLFDKKGPNINTANPSAEFSQKGKSIADMSPEEQKALAKQIDKQEGKTLGW